MTWPEAKAVLERHLRPDMLGDMFAGQCREAIRLALRVIDVQQKTLDEIADKASETGQAFAAFVRATKARGEWMCLMDAVKKLQYCTENDAGATANEPHA